MFFFGDLRQLCNNTLMSDTNSSKEQQNDRSSRVLGTILALLLAVAAFFAGLGFSGSSLASDNIEHTQSAGLLSALFGFSTAPDSSADMREFWRVWNLMEEKYVTASGSSLVSDEERLEGAIEGMVRSYGDPYSVFLPPSDAEQFGENIAGNFGGVGMEIGLRDGLLTVIAPLPGTPAEQSGIMAGDIIVTIDDTDTDGMSIDEAVQRIRGEKGTDVTLGVFREGVAGVDEIVVTRDTIAIPTVATELEDDVFIISLYSFNALAEVKMREALEQYAASGTKKLVLDLRGNPGGYLQSAVAIASYFLPAGDVVVREQFSEGEEEEVYRSQGRTLGQYAPEELVVLVNGGSASASEILAGALKEQGVATVIGETTFGKGSVQELVELPGGSSLKVTIARWLTPDGTSISEGGLEPNIVVERTVEQVVAGEDPQLDAAIRYANGDRSFIDAEDVE